MAPVAIVYQAAELSHADACRLADWALRCADRARTIVIDLNRAMDAETAAFARLVLLRRALLQRRCDLRITGLRDRAAKLFEVNRLGGVLPRE
jgi:anti-anti-sigma regulatory factor